MDVAAAFRFGMQAGDERSVAVNARVLHATVVVPGLDRRGCAPKVVAIVFTSVMAAAQGRAADRDAHLPPRRHCCSALGNQQDHRNDTGENHRHLPTA